MNSQERLEKAKEFIRDLEDRGLIKDSTWKEELSSLLASGKRVYMGIDPTAPFLHLGHYLGFSVLKRFANEGYPIVVLIGSLTARIGDPSFRSKKRKFNADVESNTKVITEQVSKLFEDYLKKKDKFGSPLCEIVDNYEFHNKNLLGEITSQKQPLSVLLRFIDEVCAPLNLCELIKKDFLASRLGSGLTLAELLYTCLQGWDFLYLYQHMNVAIQIGGSDQWGNMLTGLELIFKQTAEEANLDVDLDKCINAGALTFPLLSDKSGNKFGKSEGNAISINNSESEFQNPYMVMQYLLNVPDDSVRDYLLKLTWFSKHEIEEMVTNIKEAKKELADSVCRDIFGDKKTSDSRLVSQDIFGGLVEAKKYGDLVMLSKFIPYTHCTWNENLKLSSVFQELGLVRSKSEFNRLVASNGIFVNGVSSEELRSNGYILKQSYMVWDEENVNNGALLVKRGKKHFGLLHVTKVISPFN